MSEKASVYIACAAGQNAFTDCLIQRVGDLIRLQGHAAMDFTATDAQRLAETILALLGHPAKPPAAPRPMESCEDRIVEAVRHRLAERSQAGQLKYGATMTRTDLSLLTWIRHAQEEALDQAVYLERIYDDLERIADDGR